MRTRAVVSVCILCIASLGCVSAEVVINEIAWSGTVAGSSDEWIELHNPSEQDVSLVGWVLSIGDTEIHLGETAGSTVEVRQTTVPAGGYFLLERTDDTTVADIDADVLYRGSLSNDGADVRLIDPDGCVVDEALFAEAGWPAGVAVDDLFPYTSMERLLESAIGPGWVTCVPTVACNGIAANGEPICGTPKAVNSGVVLAASCPMVQLTEPVGGAIQGTVIVRWSATDPDGDNPSLVVGLVLSAGDDSSVVTVVENLANAGSYAWDTTVYPDGEYSLRIAVTDADGYTGFDRMDGLIIENGS